MAFSSDPPSRVVFFDTQYWVEDHEVDYKAILDWFDRERKDGGYSGKYPRENFKFSSIKGMCLLSQLEYFFFFTFLFTDLNILSQASAR